MLESYCELCVDQKEDCCIHGLKNHNIEVFVGEEEIRKIGSFHGFEKKKFPKIPQFENYKKQEHDIIWKNICDILRPLKVFCFAKNPHFVRRTASLT